MRRIDADAFAHDRGGDADAAFVAQCKHAFERLEPRMHRQVEGAVVDRQQPATTQVLVRAHGFFRLHVHVGPLHVVGTGLHQGQVERAEAPADLGEAVEVTTVAAEEHPALAVVDHP